MLSKSARALGAIVLALSSSAFAGSYYLEPGHGAQPWIPSSNLVDDTFLTVTAGTVANRYGEPAVFADPDNYIYTLDLAPAGALSGSEATGLTGTFTGTYSFYYNGSIVSQGTVTTQGTKNYDSFPVFLTDSDGFFVLDGNGDPIQIDTEYFFRNISYTAGLFTQTSGSGIPGFGGSATAAFEGGVGNDGFWYFEGILSDAGTAVPLPASATMGLGLVGLLGATQVARRRSRTA